MTRDREVRLKSQRERERVIENRVWNRGKKIEKATKAKDVSVEGREGV